MRLILLLLRCVGAACVFIAPDPDAVPALTARNNHAPPHSESDVRSASRPDTRSELLGLSRLLSGDASARVPDTTLFTLAASVLLLAVPLLISITSKAISSGMAFTIVHSAVRAFMQLTVLGSLILSPLISLDMSEASSRAVVGGYMTLMALIGSYEGEK